MRGSNSSSVTVPLVRWSGLRDKRSVQAVANGIRTISKTALEFALPARCPGCGAIVDSVHSFCAECWKQLTFLGSGGCKTCGLPLSGTDASTCAACLARPPRIDRTRAAVAYADLTRRIALRLKYGRKVALAKTMAKYMAPLIESHGGAILVPVPLHRSRLWNRGFNQAVLVARELSRMTAVQLSTDTVRRTRRTPSLKGMSPSQRRRITAGAFRVEQRHGIEGRTVILIDDVLTTGSTANACARALKRAGAARVELVSWARVLAPSQIGA